MEGALARTRGLREIVSETGNGWGTIRLSIDKEENIDAIKLYLGSVVRSVKSGFPEGVQNTVPVKKLKKNGSFY